jgi:hypothetical protein
MLRSFRVGNHKSFRDEVELILLPAFGGGSTGSARPVPVAAVYGANAAGKSNLLDALQFMRDAVLGSFRSWPRSEGVPRRAFRLDPSSAAEPSTYVVEIELEGVRYTYGFVVDDEGVLEEWLYSYPHTKRRRRLFDRRGSKVSFGEGVTGKSKAAVLAELTRPNVLFLSMAAQLEELAQLLPVHRWFADGVSWSRPSRLSTTRDLRAMNQRLVTYLDDNPRRADDIKGFVRAADVGIDDVVVERPSQHSLVVNDSDGELVSRPQQPRFRLSHGGDALFDLWDESDGTLAWLNMLPGALTALAAGGLLVVDEIDASLHPNLTALLIQQFRSQWAVARGAQLLFTTHDATLLGTSFGEEVLGRDEVWFVDKGATGVSRLYPLSDFHPRKEGENRERRYLGGSYGAIPVLGQVDLPRGAQG